MKETNLLGRFLLLMVVAPLAAIAGCQSSQTLTQTTTPGTLTATELALPVPSECAPAPGVVAQTTPPLTNSGDSDGSVGGLGGSGTSSSIAPPTYTCGPAFLVTGPDKNLWLTNPGGDTVYSASYDAANTSLNTTAYPVAQGRGPAYITVGPDGGVWFGEVGAPANLLSLITAGTIDGPPPTGLAGIHYLAELIPDLVNQPPNPATFNEFQVPILDTDYPLGLALGSDGNLWSTNGGGAPFTVAGVEPAFKLAPLQQTNVPQNEVPLGIAFAADGSEWVAEPVANKLAHITYTNLGLSGITEYPATTSGNQVGPTALTIGADGDLWYTESLAGKIGRMVINGTLSQPTGTIVGEYATPSSPSNPADLVIGPDCNIWFTEMATGLVGSVDPSGNVLEYGGLSAGAQPLGIALGADGELWVAESGLNQLARIQPSSGWANTNCSSVVLPAIAKCNNEALLLGTDPGKCYTTITPGLIDAGSSDPNNPGTPPVETVSPTQIPLPPLNSFPVLTEEALLVSPSAAPPNSAPLPHPVSACHTAIFTHDTTPPTVTCSAPVKVRCTGKGGTAATVTATATDPCVSVGKPICSPSGLYPPGTTDVTCSVQNSAGVTGSCNTIVDVTEAPPSINSLSPNPSTIQPGPGSATVNITAKSSDRCDNVAPTCTVTSVSGGPGAEITGPLQVSLPATPRALVVRRIYTIGVTCTGLADNSSTAYTTVTVVSPITGH